MLEELKRQVLRTARQAQRDGLCMPGSGNVSARDPETGLIVVTPTGKDRDALTEEDMVVMDRDARVVEALTGLKPTSECLMHLRIYQVRPRVRAVVHTHAMFATVFAVLDRPIPAITYEMMVLNCRDGIVPVAPYARPGTAALADAVDGVCRRSDVFLLKGHGAVSADETGLEGAYRKMRYLEEIAALYHHILTVNGGRDPDLFSPEELQAHSYPPEVRFPEGWA